MAARAPARLTRGEARRFGLLVGTALLLLGAVARARSATVAGHVVMAAGAALVLLAVVVPGALAPVHRVWMGASARVASVTTPIVLGIVYFGVVTPIGVARRFVVRRRLRAAPAGPDGRTRWVARDEPARPPADMEHQF